MTNSRQDDGIRRGERTRRTHKRGGRIQISQRHPQGGNIAGSVVDKTNRQTQAPTPTKKKKHCYCSQLSKETTTAQLRVAGLA